MRKPAFLANEHTSRLMISLLLCVGMLWPLLLAFDLPGDAPMAIAASAVILTALTLLPNGKKGRLLLLGALALAAAVQLFLPSMGFFGAAFEAIKALSLYFTGVTSAALLFHTQIALLLTIALALLSYVFSSKAVGFLPATVLVVLMLFGLWSLGKHLYLWNTLPALVGLLLLISQSSHEKINLFQVLPMAALVVVLGMLLLPQGETTIRPLYTAAMDLKQAISDYLFFTEPRNVFTLGSYGYYPMGSGKLGGEATPSEYPVMMVKTEQKTLLRAVSKDEYTGRSWRDTSSGKRYLYVNPRWADLRARVFQEELPGDAVRAASPMLDQKAIAVQMQNTAASTVFTPVFLRSASMQSDMVPYFNDASELFITRDLISGDRYTVFAPVLEGGSTALGALVDAAPKDDDKGYQSLKQQYTKLPDHLEQRVYDDLHNIVASSTTPYDKACAIMRHLQRYYRYSLTPASPPENQDFVTYFLYVGKEGYCTYFASAMTVLCRMADLPARYVEGFLAQPTGDGLAYVTGLDAHAWTEVYFEGFGWIPFDPTPARQNLDNPPEDEQAQEPEPSPTPEPTPSPQPSDQEQPPTPSPNHPEESQEPDMEDEEPPPDQPPFPWWILLVLAAAAAVTVRMHLRMPDQMIKKQQTDQQKLFIYGSATYALLKLLKRKPRPGETPLRFARRMDKQQAFAAPILPLWRMLALSNYSRMKPGAEQTARAKETFMRIYKTQKPMTKLLFLFTVGFDKRCYTSLNTVVEHTTPEPSYSYTSKVAAQKGAKKRAKKGKAPVPKSRGHKGAKPSKPARDGAHKR
ncbi:MAG: transglutaminase-like domain-containing protein, partial [Clostridia bacterium]